MSRQVVIVAKIEFSAAGVISTLGVSSVPYFQSAAGLLNSTWYPILDPAVSVSSEVALPWDDGEPDLEFGDLVLYNGGDSEYRRVLDLLLENQTAGNGSIVKRGYTDQPFDSLEEQIYIGKNGATRFDGERVTIAQRSALQELEKPLITTVFDDDTPNPRLVNKTPPLLLGQCFQLEPLIFDAFNELYYVASNLSNVSAVREGGAKTLAFDVWDNGFQMLDGAQLQLTADAIGPEPDGGTSKTAVVDWDFSAWTSDDPDDIDVTENPSAAEISESAGGNEADVTVTAAPTGDTGWISLTDPFEPVFATLEGNGAWTAVSAASVEDAVVADDGSYAEAKIFGTTTFRVAGFNPGITAGYDITGCEVELIAESDNDIKIDVLTVNQTNPGTRIASYIGVTGSGITENDLDGGNVKTTISGGGANFIGGGIGVREDTTAEDVNPGCHFTLKLEPRSDPDATVRVYRVRIKLHYSPSIDIVRLFTPTGVLEPGERHTVKIDLSAADIYARFGGSSSSGGALNDPADAFSTSLIKLDSAGSYEMEFVPDKDESYFGIEFKRLNLGGTCTIDRIKVEKRSDGKNRYKELVPYMASLVGLSESDNIAQTLIDQHDADCGSPEIGWAVFANESMSEIMNVFARSLSGVWWADRDSKIRSALWSNPGETADFTISNLVVDGETRRAGILEGVIVESDPAPNATERAVGARNWRPLNFNETAGIAEEFNEQERANVIEEWRVRRRANFDSLNPWVEATLTLTSISPATGDEAGGTSVTITGENFDTGASSTDVTFGGSSATNITVVSSTEITCDTPSGTAGDVDVVVTQDGESATLTDGFEYVVSVTPFTGIQTHSGGNTFGTDRRIGWRFTVGSSDLTCNTLRLKAETSQDETVQVHKWSDGTLIAEATITAVAGSWAEASVAQFTLDANTDYIVSMIGTNFPSNRTVRANETNTFYSGLTYVESRTATSDTMPTLSTGNSYTACDIGYS